MLQVNIKEYLTNAKFTNSILPTLKIRKVECKNQQCRRLVVT